MFDRIKYAHGVNKCIAEIGVKPHCVNATFRKEIREVGYWFKNTPQECATAILYKVTAGQRPKDYDVVLSDWIDRGLVRRTVLETMVH